MNLLLSRELIAAPITCSLWSTIAVTTVIYTKKPTHTHTDDHIHTNTQITLLLLLLTLVSHDKSSKSAHWGKKKKKSQPLTPKSQSERRWWATDGCIQSVPSRFETFTDRVTEALVRDIMWRTERKMMLLTSGKTKRETEKKISGQILDFSAPHHHHCPEVKRNKPCLLVIL